MAALNVNLAKFDTLSQVGLRKEVCMRRVALWKSQKIYEAARTEWLRKEVKERPAAAGDKDWEKKLDQMIQVAESRAIDGRLGVITKGVESRLFPFEE